MKKILYFKIILLSLLIHYFEMQSYKREIVMLNKQIHYYKQISQKHLLEKELHRRLMRLKPREFNIWLKTQKNKRAKTNINNEN